jgi:pimeloyl-ACP methyl ester carboxylesterase
MPVSYKKIRDEAMHKLGIGTTREMKSVVKGVFLPVMLDSEYRFSEKINIWRGKWSQNSSDLWNEILKTDLTKKITRLEVPVYFFSGIHDYTCSYILTRDYFEELQAPVKEFYTFYHSAHSPLFEEPDRMEEILVKEILKGEADEIIIKSNKKGL